MIGMATSHLSTGPDMATKADVHRIAVLLGARACALLVAFCALAGCATVGVIGQKDAVAYARDNVCGVGAADSVCVVRSVERTQEGFRVVIDRRPPAGRDRLAVAVSGGLLSKVRIEATPIDTATRRP